jgi:hypothetical protein
MKKKTNSLAITILVAVLVGAAAFYGGMQYEKTKASSASNAQFAGAGAQRGQGFIRGAGGGRNGMNRPVTGEIVSQDASSITVKMQDGSTKIVNLTDKTTINKSESAAKTDLKTGEQVTAFGAANSDGSVTAQMVSLGTNMMFRTGAQGGAMMQRGGPGQLSPAPKQ